MKKDALSSEGIKGFSLLRVQRMFPMGRVIAVPRAENPFLEVHFLLKIS